MPHIKSWENPDDLAQVQKTSSSTKIEGQHHDKGKYRYDLLPPDAINEIVGVLTYGATKYCDENWRAGISYKRLFGSVMRHMWAWFRREDNDPESGFSHLAHAACNILFLLDTKGDSYKNYDTRPRKNKP